MAYRKLSLEERLYKRGPTPDYAISEQFARLLAKLNKVAQGNTAPIPLALNQEYDEAGNLVWYVMIHVRIPGVTEYEVEAHAISLPDALSDTTYALSKQYLLRTGAIRSAEIFGYTL